MLDQGARAGPRHFTCEFPHKMALVTCASAFRLPTFAQRVGPGPPPQHPHPHHHHHPQNYRVYLELLLFFFGGERGIWGLFRVGSGCIYIVEKQNTCLNQLTGVGLLHHLRPSGSKWQNRDVCRNAAHRRCKENLHHTKGTEVADLKNMKNRHFFLLSQKRSYFGAPQAMAM